MNIDHHTFGNLRTPI